MLETTYNDSNCTSAGQKEMKYLPVDECLTIGGLARSAKVGCWNGVHNPTLTVYNDSCVNVDTNFTAMSFHAGVNSLPGSCQPWGEGVWKRFTCPVTPGYVTMSVYTDSQCATARTGADAMMQLPLRTCSWKYLPATQAILTAPGATNNVAAAPADRPSWQSPGTIALIPGTSRFDIVGDKDEEFELDGVSKSNFSGMGSGGLYFVKERSDGFIYLKQSGTSLYLTADGSDVILNETGTKLQVDFVANPIEKYGALSATRYSTRSNDSVDLIKYSDMGCTTQYATSSFDSASCMESEIMGSLVYVKFEQYLSQTDAIMEQFTTTAIPNTTLPRASASGAEQCYSLWAMLLLACARVMTL
jgi:hypothetical protein